MFKKIIFIAIIFSPLWYSLFIGYPVISDQQYALREQERPGISVSKRCFGVGDFKQLTECFHYERLSGKAFFDEIAKKTNQISPGITLIVILSLTGFFVGCTIWFIKM